MMCQIYLVRDRLNRAVFVLTCIIYLCTFHPLEAFAQKKRNIADFYASQLKEERNENWLQRELREFRTFPHLDKAYQLMAKGKTQDAVAEINRYLSIDPKDARVRMMLVVIDHQSGAYAEVIRQTGLILKYHASFIPALLYKGLALTALRRDTEAIRCLQSVLRIKRVLDKDRIFATKALADLLIRNKKYEEALVPLEYLSQKSPQYSVYIEMGLVFERLGKPSEALRLYKKAIALAKGARKKRDAYAYAAEAARKAKDLATLEHLLKEAVRFFPEHRPFIVALAHITYEDKRYDESMAWMERALVIKDTPKEREYLDNLGAVKSSAGSVKSIKEIKRELSQSGKHKEYYKLYMLLGYAYMQKKNFKRALSAFESALKLRKTDVAASKAIVEASLRLKDFSKAVDAQRRVTERQPTTKNQLRFGIMLSDAERLQEAALILRKVVAGAKNHEDYLTAVRYYVSVLERQRRIPPAIQVLVRAYKKFPLENNLASLILELLNKLRDCDEKLQYVFDLNWDMTDNDIARRLAIVYEQCESPDRAVAVYKKLLWKASSEDGTKRLYFTRIANLLSSRKKYTEAANYYVAAIAEGTNTAARHVNKSSMFEKDTLQSEIAKLYDHLGECRIMEKKHRLAARAWLNAYNLAPSAWYLFRAISSYTIAGDLKEVDRLAKKVQYSKLSPEEKAKLWEKIATMYWQNDDAKHAADFYLKAEMNSPSAKRQFAIGHCYIKMGDFKRALAAFKKAAEMDNTNPDYETAVARVMGRTANWAELAERYEHILSKHPEQTDVYLDAAYAYMHVPDNDRAVELLKRAIDVRNNKLRTSYNDNLYREIYRLRQEVTTLSNLIDLDAYYSFTTDVRTWSGAPRNIKSDTVPSQGGIRIALQPPVIGYRDGRVFNVYSRVLWNIEPKTVEPISGSLQGGAGVLYKPLRDINWSVLVEGLFKIGDLAQNNLLLGSMISWGLGTNLHPATPAWIYTTVFADVAFWAIEQQTVSVSGEFRQGVTFNIADILTITPHLGENMRYQVNELSSGLYLEGGPGLLIKGFLYQNSYEVELSSLELLVQYKWGCLTESLNRIELDVHHGLYMTLRYRF